MDMTPAQSVWRVPYPTANPPLPQPEGLLEDGVDALPVRMSIVQDDVITGWDDGALGFEGDAVWFSGRACSFRIAAADILPGTYRLSRHEAVTDGEALKQGFPLRHPTREVWVRIELLDLEGRKEWEDEIRLIREVKRLRALTEGGVSEYPPLVPRPGLIVTPLDARKADRLRVLGTAMFLTGLVLSLFKAPWAMGSVLTCVGVWTFLPSERSSSPDQQRLRGIAREEERARSADTPSAPG